MGNVGTYRWPITGIDAVVERAYERLTWRLPVACALFHWFLVLGFHGLFISQVGRIAMVPMRERGTWLAWVVAGLVVAAALGAAVSVRLARPLGRALAHDTPDAAVQALELARRLPGRLILANSAVGAVVSIPVTVWATLQAVPITPGLLVTLTFAGIGAGLLLGVSSWAAYRILMLPMLRELSRRIPDYDRGRLGVSAGIALILALPALAFGVGIGAVVIGAPTGSSWGQITGRFAVAFGLGLPFILPLAWLIAFANVQPLDELIAAAKRLRAGDYRKRVPVLPGAEFEELARTLNAAMEGLEERHRLAGANAELLEEVRASRARIVAAGDAERRRVERNIHDGAQQRLVALALELRLLEDVAEDRSAPEIVEMVREAGLSLKSAMEELRELARGLHPAVLATDGIKPALRQVAARAPLRVTVDAPDERFEPVVESTVYFVVSEALANVAKHAGAGAAAVRVARSGDRLVVAVSDDGVGGAEPERGTGLAGLADQVAALDGVLHVESRPGAGTRLVVELPVS